MNSPIENEHLSRELILRVLDDEVTPSERLQCEAHLPVCELCRQAVSALGDFSLQIESAVQSVATPSMESVRQHLVKELGTGEIRHAALPQPAKVMRRFGWGMGIAATLAFGVLLAPRHDVRVDSSLNSGSSVSTILQSSTIEVEGETFLSVPYSNSDLSTGAPHIVQMQVPVSSLADIGIVFEPVMSRIGSGPDAERSVLADVLIGADGQPRGVHVLETE